MRRLKTIPKTDLDKLLKEVLSRGPAAALPRNLPDRWLRALGRDIARARKANLEGHNDDPAIDIAAPLLLVATLTQAKSAPASETAFGAEDLKKSLDKFAVAIAEEIVGRETGVFVREYTLDNIFEVQHA